MSNELKHFGVLGMKWGVRRYQNKDGTLNSAGKKRAKRIESSRKEGIAYANKLAADQKKGVAVANTLISAQKKAKETGKVDSDFLNHPNISQKAKNKVTRLANKANKKPLTEKEKKSRNKKLMKKGTSVAVGLLGGAFGAINVYTITGSPMAVAILAPTIGSLTRMRYDKLVDE